MITIKDFEQSRFESVVTMSSHNKAVRDELAREVKDYIAAGGKITYCETGLSTTSKGLNYKENKANMKKTAHKKKDSIGRDKSPWHSFGEQSYKNATEKKYRLESN
jgi:hypothetical protein